MRKLLILAALAFGGCSREVWRAPMAADTTLLTGLPVGGKYKFTGPVNITLQKGNNNVATPTATGKVKADAAATGPGSSATATTKSGPAWWVYLLIALAGAAAWEWLRRQLSFLPFLR
jgi:hypothetical protein